MKKLILFLCIFFSFNLFGEKNDIYKQRINEMLNCKKILEIDEDKLYDTYISNDDVTQINKGIINKCINLYQDKSIPEYTEIHHKNGIYYLSEVQEDGHKVNGYYHNGNDIQSFDKGELKEYYEHSNDIHSHKATIGGHYTVNFFDNIIYYNFINNNEVFRLLDSMDRTYFEFIVDEQKTLKSFFAYIYDHIKKVAIGKQQVDWYTSSTTVDVIIYKVYKTAKIFYSTGELMIDADFECFSNVYYHDFYPPSRDPKIFIGQNWDSLFNLRYFLNGGEDFTYKVNKLNVYNKDGTINKNIQQEIDSRDPYFGYWDIIEKLLNDNLGYQK